MVSLVVAEERFAYLKPFRITGHLFTETAVLSVQLTDGEHVGRGEAAGVYYLGDDLAAMRTAVESVRGAIEGGADRDELQTLLPPGGARNALDCALWDLESQRTGSPVWQLAGLSRPEPLKTTVTISAQSPNDMAAEAAKRADFPRIKLKLTGDAAVDIARVQAVRKARPDCWLGVDANQGYDRGSLGKLMPALIETDVALLEQPVRRDHEGELDGLHRPMPFAADESICALAELDRAAGRYDVVNIKLDKCGGLTEGLAIARACRAQGLGVMVGNMMGTSLAMAPSAIVGQLCDVVDLDGPLFLARDRSPGATYTTGLIDTANIPWGLGNQILR